MYDFRSLSPHDFECLTRDLLQAELAVHLESFAQGRDEGIDLRYAPARGTKLIVQCKHYVGSSFDTLKRELERSERLKLPKLRPARYILVTSLPLTPLRKEKLQEILRPWVKTPGDIIGAEDLNNVIGKHPSIERKHYKLWMTTTAVLERVLHAGIFNRTASDIEAIRRRIALYAPTRDLEGAEALLKSEHYCIIAGAPGIGKTMLADILAIEHLHRGYEPVSIHRAIDDAWQMYAAEKPQFFLYDDFLGQTALSEKLGHNEDSSLLRFIETVQRNPKSRLVLTTREYILEQARQKYEPLARAAKQQPLHVIRLEGFRNADKARIFANHLYFNGAPPRYIDWWATNRRYVAVTQHRNFNPRIIEWLTTRVNGQWPEPEPHSSECVAMLDNPRDLWVHAFENQLTAPARALLLVFSSLPESVAYDDFEAIYLAMGDSSGVSGAQTFKLAFRELDGSFLLSRRDAGMLVVQASNPSVRDFLVRYLIENREVALRLVEGAAAYDQIERVGEILARGPGLSSLERVRFWRGAANMFSLPDCNTIHHVSGSNEELRKVRLSSCSRLARIMQVWPTLGETGGAQWVTKMLDDLLQEIARAQNVDRSGVATLVSRLVGLPEWRKEGIAFANAVANKVAAGVEWWDDCMDVIRFLEAAEGHVALDAAVAADYRALLEGELEGVLVERDPDLLRNLMDDLDLAERWLEAEYVNEREQLELRAKELEKERFEPDFDDSGGWRRPEGVSEETEEDVFGSFGSAPRDE